ncbi:hypothetical protein [Mycobacterium marinum]|uniref:hypothetical protein n=1 Tax=Mycobacterium marinum TaxID=1781 RepID=UPI0019213440|nr:hypothetical protein [Mycobacterium marinum]QQW36883.1 hypothetical protein HXW97_25950 [Mycobacterium marinum]
MSESGLTRVGGVIVLSGPALKAALQAVLIAVKHRKLSGIPSQTYEALACELGAAMAAAGHSDVPPTAVSNAVPMHQPTVPLDEAAEHLGVSRRQARRRAKQLGGQKIAGRWFVDELALREHTEGKR